MDCSNTWQFFIGFHYLCCSFPQRKGQLILYIFKHKPKGRISQCIWNHGSLFSICTELNCNFLLSFSAGSLDGRAARYVCSPSQQMITEGPQVMSGHTWSSGRVFRLSSANELMVLQRAWGQPGPLWAGRLLHAPIWAYCKPFLSLL